jgi:hypothetical protein
MVGDLWIYGRFQYFGIKCYSVARAGAMAYIKVTGYTDGRPPVIQFKRLEDAS